MALPDNYYGAQAERLRDAIPPDREKDHSPTAGDLRAGGGPEAHGRWRRLLDAGRCFC
jgi:hypothetical protein